jgi:hypothetical protein
MTHAAFSGKETVENTLPIKTLVVGSSNILRVLASFNTLEFAYGFFFKFSSARTAIRVESVHV